MDAPAGNSCPSSPRSPDSGALAPSSIERTQPAPSAASEPWRRRLVRQLLYGRSVDRAVKTRARIGLTILVFALGYSVIAARLVMFATVAEGHGGRRATLADAVGTARPDVLDRNGEILATDVRTPSLFGEPHRIID